MKSTVLTTAGPRGITWAMLAPVKFLEKKQEAEPRRRPFEQHALLAQGCCGADRLGDNTQQAALQALRAPNTVTEVRLLPGKVCVDLINFREGKKKKTEQHTHLSRRQQPCRGDVSTTQVARNRQNTRHHPDRRGSRKRRVSP